MNDIDKMYRRDKKTWDQCAETYEKQIVGGHPDILAFEEFEEDMLDDLLRFLSRQQRRPIKLMDIGCGSGRLHLRYGTITAPNDPQSTPDPINRIRKKNPKLKHDTLLAERMQEVWGIDFSGNMIDIAGKKLKEMGLDRAETVSLSFDQGSAFRLAPQKGEALPVMVCLVNSIGVMQGPEGARSLFKSFRNALEAAGGIGIISCYQQEYLESYGLGQYESTMDVSGQPSWVVPETYASPDYIQVPRAYKRAHSHDPEIKVDVYDRRGGLVKKDHLLKRDPEKTKQVIESGHITTHGNYESNWYSFQQIDDWIQELWPAQALHIKTKDLDPGRAEPAQMAILDFKNRLDPFFQSWRPPE